MRFGSCWVWVGGRTDFGPLAEPGGDEERVFGGLARGGAPDDLTGCFRNGGAEDDGLQRLAVAVAVREGSAFQFDQLHARGVEPDVQLRFQCLHSSLFWLVVFSFCFHRPIYILAAA
jgi:hypothetical protein